MPWLQRQNSVLLCTQQKKLLRCVGITWIETDSLVVISDASALILGEKGTVWLMLWQGMDRVWLCTHLSGGSSHLCFTFVTKWQLLIVLGSVYILICLFLILVVFGLGLLFSFFMYFYILYSVQASRFDLMHFLA